MTINKSSFHFLPQYLCMKASCFKKTCAVFLVLCFIVYILLRMPLVLQWPSSFPPNFTQHGFTSPSPASCNLSQPQSLFDNEPVIILYWDYPWGISSYAPPECQTQVTKEGYCVVTRDKRRIKNAYAVLFHYTTLAESDIPWKHYR